MDNDYSKHAHKHLQILNSKLFIYPCAPDLIFYFLTGFSTLKLLKCFNNQRIAKLLQKQIMNSIPIEANLQRCSQKHLIYTYGKVAYQNSKLAKDDLFKVSSSSLDCLGLYRKVEVYHNYSNYHKLNCQWQDSRLFENIFHISNQPYIGSKVTTNGDIFLEGQKLASPLLIQLFDNNSVRLKIDTTADILNLISETLQKKEIYQNQINKESMIGQSSLETQETENPLEKLALTGRHIEIKDQYIYIMKNKGEINKGDIRISFHEIEKIKTATLLALQEEGDLKEFQLLNSKEKIEYFVQGGKQTSYISLFSFITKGFVDYKDLIDLLKSSLKSNRTNEYKNILLYFIIINCLYLFIGSLYEDGYNFHNFIERKQVSQLIYEIQQNSESSSFLNAFSINQDILKKSFIQSSIHTICLKVLTSGFILLPCVLGVGLLMFILDEQAQMKSLIENIKQDLKEIRKNNEENSIQQFKELLNQ
ncbi:hypothetical protein ABPG74_001520 [Tetrahymena malaccensis]